MLPYLASSTCRSLIWSSFTYVMSVREMASGAWEFQLQISVRYGKRRKNGE
jgi:hypothetical protein